MSINKDSDSTHYIRVGDTYFKKTLRPDKNGNGIKVLVKRNKETIKDDHGKYIISEIEKYEDFVNIPSHINYQQVIHGHYNKYHEISHVPKAGKFVNIIGFLTHIFGKDHLHFILDYIQILYVYPTQKLPIILLESSEKNTGKSTFGFFMSKIFENNAVGLGNQDFESEFNSVWLDKLLVVVDETSLKTSSIMQSIKKLSTDKSQVLSNAKGMDKVPVEVIMKFIFISNDEGCALPIEKGDTRWAVFKVPTFAEYGIKDNPNILSDLEKEIPAFLHFLQNRSLAHAEVGRMYFCTSAYFTEQLQLYFSAATSYTTKAIKEMINNTFEIYPNETSLKFSIQDLVFQLNKGNYLRNIDRLQIKKSVEIELGLAPQKRGRYTLFSLYHAEMDESGLHTPIHNGQNLVHYIFDKTVFYKSQNNTISKI